MLLQDLHHAQLITPPKWLIDNCQYLTIMGSVSYGVSSDTSDMDLYGFCVPPKDIVFPHTTGAIEGFGEPPQKFNVWQQHHVKRLDSAQTYDFSVYSIVSYFQLCMQNNPNMINSLFTAPNLVVHATPMAQRVREVRREFLHKGAWHKFKGYAFSQMHKIESKSNASNPKRAETIAKHGFDTKFAYHVVRLLAEVEQIMVEGDLDLMRNREQLKAIRRGDMTLDEIKAHFVAKEKELEAVYLNSKLPHRPDEARIRSILLECLEMHYGSLDKLVARDASAGALVRDLEAVIARYRDAA